MRANLFRRPDPLIDARHYGTLPQSFVSIAEEERRRRIISAGAEAESIRIKAEAQAQAFQEIADQIGSGNAALLEMLKVIGERGIQITPRVMVSSVGETGQQATSPETVALIGTMLDSML